ncbi:hypothetical protein D1872_283310 [compost metagenome]
MILYDNDYHAQFVKRRHAAPQYDEKDQTMDDLHVVHGCHGRIADNDVHGHLLWCEGINSKYSVGSGVSLQRSDQCPSDHT